MKTLSLFCFILLITCANAQNQVVDFKEFPEMKTQVYYQSLILHKGNQYRYKAATQTLNEYPDSKDEFTLRLYNLLGEEAVLENQLDKAICLYTQTLNSPYENSYLSEGLLAEQELIKACKALCQIAIMQEDYHNALAYHKQYIARLQDGWDDILEQNQLDIDKIFALCYQHLGKSEKAINHLTPYAFGFTSIGGSEIDKPSIEHLAELIYTKYPKKAYRKMLQNITHQIYHEEKGDKLYFYLQIFDNRIYFKNDSQNYPLRAAANEYLVGEAIAHYQRKFRNSYFYRCLVKNKI